jgi:regulator of replication initiation timing
MSDEIKILAAKATSDKKYLSELLNNLQSKDDKIRFPSFQIINKIAQDNPDILYYKWDYFASFLESKNTYHNYIGIYIIANLVRVDSDKRFEKIFDKYYGLLKHNSVIPVAHIALNSDKIVKAKPDLEEKITYLLLDLGNINHKNKELIKENAILALSNYFELSKSKDKIISFVKKQVDSSSVKTRKVAKDFVKKWKL